MKINYKITIDDNAIDVEVDATVSGGCSGNYTGPYEDSYPSESPEVEINSIVRVDDDNPVDYESLSESDRDGIDEKAISSYEDNRTWGSDWD